MGRREGCVVGIQCSGPRVQAFFFFFWWTRPEIECIKPNTGASDHMSIAAGFHTVLKKARRACYRSHQIFCDVCPTLDPTCGEICAFPVRGHMPLGKLCASGYWTGEGQRSATIYASCRWPEGLACLLDVHWWQRYTLGWPLFKLLPQSFAPCIFSDEVWRADFIYLLGFSKFGKKLTEQTTW